MAPYHVYLTNTTAPSKLKINSCTGCTKNLDMICCQGELTRTVFAVILRLMSSFGRCESVDWLRIFALVSAIKEIYR